jgi:hypothetical protein
MNKIAFENRWKITCLETGKSTTTRGRRSKICLVPD